MYANSSRTKSDEVSPDLGTKTPPREHPDDNGEHQQRVEQEDGFLRREQRAEKANAERGFKGVSRRQCGIQVSLFPSDGLQVGVEERPKAIVLIRAVDQRKDRID